MAKILIVGDEIDTQLLLSTLLLKIGHTVASAKSKIEALDRVQHFDPDLIIQDVMLGNDNGFEICKEIKVRQNRTIHVIFCSAIPIALPDHKSCESFDILEKPFKISVLVKVIEKALKINS